MDQVESPPCYLTPDDCRNCLYARDYVAGGGYAASTANQLIVNLKKKPALRGTNQWPHKINALCQFADEVASLFKRESRAHIACIPGSKSKDDPEYDPRMDLMLERLSSRRPHLTIEAPFARAASGTPCHTGGSRDIERLCDEIQYGGMTSGIDTLILIDDVITRGTHFKACQRILWEYHPRLEVIGIFWTRTVRPSGIETQ